MNHRIIIHPVDLQDQEGFLTFLQTQAQAGYEAVRVYRSFSVFRKTDHPPEAYSMRFHPGVPPLGQYQETPSIPGLKNGVELFPVPGPDHWRTRWAENVSQNYGDFVPFDLLRTFHIIVRQLLFPVLVYALLLAGGAASVTALLEDLWAWGLLLVLWAVVVVGTELFVLAVDRQHLAGLRQAAEHQTPYRTPDSLQKWVRPKNGLLMFDLVPSLLVLLLLLLH